MTELAEELRSLQAKYVGAGINSMDEADVRRYLTLLEADYGAEFRDERITSLERRLRVIERIARVEQRNKDEWSYYVDCSRKLKAITDVWEAFGADKSAVADGHADVWTYEGREIFRMYGALSGLGKSVDEYLAVAQRIDEEFKELMAEVDSTS